MPDTFRIGVIGFGSSAQQLAEPTTDHARVKTTIDALQVKGATAMGDALKAAINSARIPVPDGLGGERRLPAAIVLLGDGASTRGADPIDVVQDTKKFKIPVYTVALGTQNGTLTHTEPEHGPDHDRARPAGPADAAGDRARHRRPVLRHRRRAPAADRLLEPRHAADQDQGEAAGDVGVRRRRAGAAAARRRLRARARREAAREDRPADARPHAGQARSRPVPPAVLRSLDLAVMKRIESLLPGEHLTPQVGSGTELAMIRPYFPGDDVRHIDWNATARLQEPHVRVHVGERALTSWLILDASASMAFGTADRRKWDVAEGVALAVGHVTTRRGNRLGVLSFGGAALAHHAPAPGPPRPARAAGRAAPRRRARGRRRDVAGRGAVRRRRGRPPARPGRDRVRLPRRARLGGRRCRQLRARHGVLAVEIVDPREQELVPAGDLWLVDPETGRQVHVDTRKRRVRARFAEAAAAERDEVRTALRRTGADHVVLSTAGDWLRIFASHLRRGEAALRAGAPARAAVRNRIQAASIREAMLKATGNPKLVRVRFAEHRSCSPASS